MATGMTAWGAFGRISRTLKQSGGEMEKIVYFVRHGQSLANAAAIFQPRIRP